MKFSEIINWQLREAPKPIKALALGYVLALGLAYIYALGNIAIVVGLSPKNIAVHYYGAEKTIQEAAPQTAGEQELNLEDLSETTKKPELGPRPSFKNLVAEGHFHLFGMSSFFFGIALLGLFIGIPEKWKAILILGSFIGIILDNVSFMATRFLGPQFAYLTALSGSIMGLCFFTMWILIIRELFLGCKKGGNL